MLPVRRIKWLLYIHFLNVFTYLSDETCFRFVTGGRICNSKYFSFQIKWFFILNQIIFCSESRIVSNYVSNQKCIMYSALSCFFRINLFHSINRLVKRTWRIKVACLDTILLDNIACPRLLSLGTIFLPVVSSPIWN